MSLPLERIEGKYEIVGKIRDGGMGAVYRVRHRLLDEVRVIKTLRSKPGFEEELRARFAQEARMAIRLRHPNVVQVFDFTLDDDGVGFIVMEHIDGVDLGQIVANGDRLSLPLLLELGRQALRALGYLHRQGFVHRDVSPDNLMLTRDVDGQPLIKIIDLGIAKDHESEQSLTLNGTFVGKFRYASPEHFEAEGPGDISARSDLYALGLVLYELLTGHHPITGDDPTALVAGHLFRPPRPFADTDPDRRVPEALRAIVLRAMAKRPEERFADAAAFADALAVLQEEWPIDEAVRQETDVLVAGDRSASPTATAPGSTQHRMDIGFDLSRTPSPVTLVDVASTSVGHLLVDGRNRATDGDVAGAIRAYEEALARSPKDPEAQRELTEALTRRDAESARWRVDVETQLEAAEGALGESIMTANDLLAAARSLIARPPAVAAAADVEAIERRIEAVEASIAKRRDSSEGVSKTVAGIRGLIEEDLLVEADRALYQALERFGERDELLALRQELDAIHHQRRQQRIDDLLERADELAAAGDFPAALDCMHRAKAAAPEGSELERRLTARGDTLQQRADDHHRHQSILDAEREILTAIRQRRLDDAARVLTAAQGRFGAIEPFGALGEILQRTRNENRHAERVTRLLRDAREHLGAKRFAAAATCLREAAELDPTDRWIRARLAETEAELAPTADDEHPDAEARGAMEALARVDHAVRHGDQLGAWQTLRQAIEDLGPLEPLVERRRQLADAMLEDSGFDR